MEIGIYATTHGLAYRDDQNVLARSLPADQLRPVETAQLAERLGFHSMWFPDHVCMPMASESEHVANASGSRAYESRHTMFDAAVVMGAVAHTTTSLKLGTSVLISPYRNPLSDARQFATIDQLSNGRLLFGVGAGWMQEEFAALGIPYAERGPRTNECIQVYKRAWTDDVVSYQGRFYRFAALSMDPKPRQQPPPIIYGGVTPGGARRAARLCDGFYPIFLDPFARPDRYAKEQKIIRTELDAIGRPHAEFIMMGVSSARLTSSADPLSQERPRRICTGTAEQILEDLQDFATHGYGLLVCFFDCPSGQLSELEDQMQQFSASVIPEARNIRPQGGWKPAP